MVMLLSFLFAHNDDLTNMEEKSKNVYVICIKLWEHIIRRAFIIDIFGFLSF